MSDEKFAMNAGLVNPKQAGADIAVMPVSVSTGRIPDTTCSTGIYGATTSGMIAVANVDQSLLGCSGFNVKMHPSKLGSTALEHLDGTR